MPAQFKILFKGFHQFDQQCLKFFLDLRRGGQSFVFDNLTELFQQVFCGGHASIGNQEGGFQFFIQFLIDFAAAKDIEVGSGFCQSRFKPAEPGLLLFGFGLGGSCIGSLFFLTAFFSSKKTEHGIPF